MTQEKKGPNMELEGPSEYVSFLFFIFYSHLLSAFRVFPGAVPVSIASVDANNISNVLNFVF